MKPGLICNKTTECRISCTDLSSKAGFCEGLSVCNGHLTIAAVAEEHGYEYISPMELINQG